MYVSVYVKCACVYVLSAHVCMHVVHVVSAYGVSVHVRMVCVSVCKCSCVCCISVHVHMGYMCVRLSVHVRYVYVIMTLRKTLKRVMSPVRTDQKPKVHIHCHVQRPQVVQVMV